MNAKADFYFKKGKWQEELRVLRTIAHDIIGIGYKLDEELKWGCPCYIYEKANIVLIHEFKEYCAFLFFKGALLKDPNGILIQQTQNVQSARQIRFTSVDQIIEIEPFLKSYIREAVDVEKAGLKVQLKTMADYQIPEEFQTKLDSMEILKTAFEALTPGRQRGYLFYFSQAKQAKTREARVEKCITQILAGKGLEDN